MAIVDHHVLAYLVSQPAKTSNVRLLNRISEAHAYRFNLDVDAVSSLLRYPDLEEHYAIHTVNLDVHDISGPDNAEVILQLHKLIDVYRDEIDSLIDATSREESHLHEDQDCR